ncbi:MAG TPA: alpha/beta hydrolase family protein [Thermomonospora sp.]|nr:alpha/beta hydrolase family protein [Thermomonospora sp.]
MIRVRHVLLAALSATGLGLSLVPPVHAAATEPTVVGTTVIDPDESGDDDGQTLDLTVRSPAMAADMKVRVILPEGWSPGADRTWPVLWLLHGSGQRNLRGQVSGYESWHERGMAGRLLANRQVITVMPEGGAYGWYSDWISPGTLSPRPNWETFHMVELRQLLESRYRAGSTRAIAGLSMGGFGALSYAGRHPGRFTAAAAFSAALTTTDDPYVVQGDLATDGVPHNSVWGDPLDVLGGGRQRWMAHDPYHLTATLDDIPVHVASGDGDPDPALPPDQGVGEPAPPADLLEPGALQQSRDFADRLDDTGTVTRNFYGDGQHIWPFWRRELCRALPMLLTNIGVSPSGLPSDCNAWAAANRPVAAP